MLAPKLTTQLKNPPDRSSALIHSRKVKWIGLLFVLLLTLVSYYLLCTVERFSVIDEQLLTGFHKNEESGRWNKRGVGEIHFDEDLLTIRNREAASEEVSQVVSINAPAYLEFTFDASSEGVESPGDKYWHKASGALKLRIEEEKVVKVSYVALLDNTTTVKRFSQVEYIGEEIQSVVVSFRLLNSVGLFSVEKPVLSLLEESASYLYLKYLMVGIWVAVGLIFLVVCLKVIPVSQYLALIVLLLFLFVGTLMPENLSKILSEGVSGRLAFVTSSEYFTKFLTAFGIDTVGTASSLASKLGHVIVFFCIGFFAGLNYRRAGFVFSAISLIVVAILTEVLQLLVDGRTASVFDVGIDVFGGMLGLLFGSALIACLAALVHRFTNEPSH